MHTAIDRYLSHIRHERRLSALTVKHYQRDLALLETLIDATADGNSPTAQLAPLELTQAEIRRFAATLHSRGLAPRSLARVLSGWRGFFAYAVRSKLVTVNPVDGVRPPKAAKHLPATLSPDQAVQLVSFADGTPEGIRDRAIFELLYSSGLRVSEVTGLDLDALDFSAHEVRVKGKGEKTRIVPVGEPALNALTRWLDIRQQLKGGETCSAMLGST